MEETVDLSLSVDVIATNLAYQKAFDIFKQLNDEQSFIIGADTIVVLGQEVLGKPMDVQEASLMLTKLSGREHTVITGIAFCWMHNNKPQKHLFFEKTIVEFEEISAVLLENYLATKDSLDKAGAYGIQGPSLPFIKKINGSYSNVVGFPINKIYNEINQIFNKDFFEVF